MSSETKQSETTHQETTPWAPQAGALSTAFSGALDAYNKAKGATAPNDFVAQMTPEQLANFRAALGYSTNNAIPGQNAATGSALQTAGVDATRGALSGLDSFDPSANTNPAALVEAAKSYAAGQDIDSQVNNAMLNARQTARDVTLPGIENAARTNGNTNSSRTAIREGMVDRGLAEQATDLGASLRSDAFTKGLALASGTALGSNAQKLGALSTQAGAGTTAAGTGVNASSGSIDDAKNIFGIGADAGAGLQASQQSYLDNLYAQYKQQTTGSYDPLAGLMSIIGTNNWGGTTDGTATKTTTPSAWSVIGGLLGGAGNIASTAGGLGWKPFGK
jgi:hypothetical protein